MFAERELKEVWKLLRRDYARLEDFLVGVVFVCIKSGARYYLRLDLFESYRNLLECKKRRRLRAYHLYKSFKNQKRDFLWPDMNIFRSTRAPHVQPYFHCAPP